MAYSAKSGNQGQRVTELLEKCSHYDKDERYMATNDLCNELIKGLAMDEPLEQRICTAILKQLDDQSNDVQSVAVKCLGVLFKRIHLVQMEKIADKLCKHVLGHGNESLRDIYAIGLKTLVLDIPEDLGVNVAERMTAQLLNGIADKKSSVEVKRECIDILSELLSRFGRCMQGDHERIMNVLLAQLQDPKPVIKKRASICLGSLSFVLSDELLDLMVKIILQQIGKAEAERQSGHLLAIRTLIHTIGTISRSVGRRLRSHLGVMVPLFIRFCGRPSDQEEDNEDFDEMVENCFSGVESFVASCPPSDMTPFLSSILEAAVLFVSYDPNFCYGDDDEDGNDGMDIDAGNDDDGDYGDMDEDVGAEDDDHSWKVRKAAARVIAAVIRHGEQTFDGYLMGSHGVGDLLIGRFKERVENSENSSDPRMGDMEVIEDSQSSLVESVSVDASHIHFFVSHTAKIAKKCKVLFAASKGGSSGDDAKTRVAALGVIRMLAVAMQGHVNLLIPDLLDAIRACLSDSQQAVKLESVLCLRHIYATHLAAHRVELQQRLPLLLPAVHALVNEEWYKLTIEGLKLYNAFVVTLRPALPASSPVYTMYDVTCALSDSAVNDAVHAIYTSVFRHVASQDNDQEVRECGLAVMGALLAHFGDNLLNDGNRSNEIFSLLLRRVENEVTRMAAMRALIHVASSSRSFEYTASSDLVSGSVFSAVTRLLGQHDRSLKQTALRLLNALVCMHPEGIKREGKVEMYDVLLSELVSLMTDSDLFICNLATAVSRSIVLRYYPSARPGSEHAALLNRSVSLIVSSSLPEQLVVELKRLLCELAKGDLASSTDSPLVAIITQLMSGTIEAATRIATIGSVVTDAPALSRSASNGGSVGGTSRGSMMNVASCLADVVLSAHQFDKSTPVSISQFSSRMIQLVKGGPDILVDQLKARGVLLAGRALSEVCVQFGLLTLGNIGKEVDASYLIIGNTTGPDVGKILFETAYGLLDHTSEDIKSAAAFCIGCLSYGNAASCLQRLIDAITGNVVLIAPAGDVAATRTMRTQHLLLTSLRIVISASQPSGGDLALMDRILQPCLLPLMCCSDEAVRGVVAECLGGLMATHDSLVLSELLNVINRSGPVAPMLAEDAAFALAEWTVATALRQGLSKRSPRISSFLIRSREVTDVFFEVLFQSHETFDLEVRKAALLLLNTLMSHNKDVIESYLTPTSRVFISLKDSLVFKKVYKVDLGPYKHEVDDGISLRKSALTCLETMLLVMPARFVAAEMLEGLMLRLSDKDGMIKLQTYQVLARVFTIDPTAFSLCEMCKLIPPLEKVIFSDSALGKKDAKPSGGDNNVRPLELLRGAIRVVLSVGDDCLLLAPANQKAWAGFTDKIMATSEISISVDQIRHELSN